MLEHLLGFAVANRRCHAGAGLQEFFQRFFVLLHLDASLKSKNHQPYYMGEQGVIGLNRYIALSGQPLGS
jgi:hypothetical protein